MVIVPVGVDDIADRFVGELAERREHRPGRGQRELGVDHDHLAVADDEETVGLEVEAGGLPPDGGIDAVRQLLQGEAGGGWGGGESAGSHQQRREQRGGMGSAPPPDPESGCRHARSCA